MSILLNTLLLYPDHPYDFDEIWAQAFGPQTKEYVKFLVTEPESHNAGGASAQKERALIAGIKEELAAGAALPRICATYAGERDVPRCDWRACCGRRASGSRMLRSSVPTDKQEGIGTIGS